jgi:hypothetical protein
VNSEHKNEKDLLELELNNLTLIANIKYNNNNSIQLSNIYSEEKNKEEAIS